MKKKNVLKSEKIVNDDGSYILKEVLKEAENNILSIVTTFNSKKQPIKRLAYLDDNFQNLYFTSKLEHKKNKSYIQYDAYEEKQEKLWQSIIGNFNSKGKQIAVQMFYDKNFEKLFIKANRSYNKNGGYTEKVKDYESKQSCIRKYNKNNKLKNEYTYKGLDFKLLLHVIFIKFFKNGNFQEKEIYVNKASYISTYNDKKQLIQYQVYNDTNFKKIFTKTEYEYQNNTLVKKTNTYPKKHYTYIDMYKYNDLGQKIEETSYINGKLSFTNKWELLKQKAIHTQYNSSNIMVGKNTYSKNGKKFISYKNGKITKAETFKYLKHGMHYLEQIFGSCNKNKYKSIKRIYERGKFGLIKEYYKDSYFKKLCVVQKWKYFKNRKYYIYEQVFDKPVDKEYLSIIKEYNKNENLVKRKLYKDRNFKKLLRIEYSEK